MKLSALLSAAILLASASAARADNFTVSYLGAGVQSSSASTSVETFNSGSASGGTYTTTFNGSGVTGTYTGNFSLVAANQFGGANGTQYITTTGTVPTAYTLSLSSSVNYFGLWFSALDPGNVLSFYNGNTLLYSFNASAFINAVGSCPTSAYCGNPNNGLDSGEQFAFINFYDANGSFNKITFSEGSNYSGQFESDNHTLGTLSSIPGGTAITPEPSSLALLGTGLLGMAGAVRRRFLRA